MNYMQDSTEKETRADEDYICVIGNVITALGLKMQIGAMDWTNDGG